MRVSITTAVNSTFCYGNSRTQVKTFESIFQIDVQTIADGIYIPKEEASKLLNQFRPISVFNVEGKVFFGVVAKRIIDFVVSNGLVPTSVQKAGILGCIEHCSMIWHTIQEAQVKEARPLSCVAGPCKCIWFSCT